MQLLICGSHLVWQASQLLRNAASSAAAAVELPAAALVWYSCRCLCLGFFLHIIKSFPRLLVAKQCSQIFFTAFFTFIFSDRGKDGDETASKHQTEVWPVYLREH